VKPFAFLTLLLQLKKCKKRRNISLQDATKFFLKSGRDSTPKSRWLHISVRPKPGFGIGNRNQDQVSVSVSGPKLFLPKPKLSCFFSLDIFVLEITLVQSNQFVLSQSDFFVRNVKLFTLLIFMP